MGRHQRHRQHGTAVGAHVFLGAATLVGLTCSTTYALAVPAAPVVAPVGAAAVEAPTGVARTCDLSAPPVFGDPAHPDRITNRACGYVDAQGRERSRAAWTDGQLLDAGR